MRLRFFAFAPFPRGRRPWQQDIGRPSCDDAFHGGVALGICAYRHLLCVRWRRPPTGAAMPCDDRTTVFKGGAPCPRRTNCKGVSWSACAWRWSAGNWRATFTAPPCSRISFGWRASGLPWRINDGLRCPARELNQAGLSEPTRGPPSPDWRPRRANPRPPASRRYGASGRSISDMRAPAVACTSRA
jgi:hypothetical protein